MPARAMVDGLERMRFVPSKLNPPVACRWTRRLDLAAPDPHDCTAAARVLAGEENSLVDMVNRRSFGEDPPQPASVAAPGGCAGRGRLAGLPTASGPHVHGGVDGTVHGLRGLRLGPAAPSDAGGFVPGLPIETVTARAGPFAVVTGSSEGDGMEERSAVSVAGPHEWDGVPSDEGILRRRQLSPWLWRSER